MSANFHTTSSDKASSLLHVPACEIEVLVLSRDGALISEVEAALAGACVVRHARKVAVAIDMLGQHRAGVLITDAPGDGAAFQVLASRLGQQFPHLIIIGVGDHQTAVLLIDLFNAGLVDRILLKPLSGDQVRQQVLSAMRQHLELRGGDNVVLPAALADPLDWEEDDTQPQGGAWIAESEVAPAPPQSEVSFAVSLPAVWQADQLRAAASHWRQPFLIGGGAVGVLTAALILAVALGGGQEAWYRGVPGARTVPDAATVDSSSEVRRALAAASRALREGWYVPPAEDNALGHYLTVLEIEPGHAQAVAGLDTLAGVMLQQAQRALNDNDIEGALAGRRMARKLRPQHPAMAFVDAEFSAYGKALISDMRLALASGDLPRAGEQIERAARFLSPDSADVAAARADLAARRDRLAIDERLALAYERMAANNLTIPENDSAQFHLLALRADYPNDEKVAGGLAKLVDTMLVRSDEAILSQNFPAAAGLLYKADQLGAPPEAVTARRLAVENGVRQKAAGEALLIAEAALTEASLQEELALAGAALKVEAVLAASESKPVRPEPLTTVDEGPVQLASTTQMVVAPQAGAGAVIDSGSVDISELEILRMVEPEYPRRAWVRDIDGWIDVEFTVTGDGQTSDIEVTGARARGWFEQAAIDAVEQWQFRPPLENGRSAARRAKVRLQFAKD